MDTSITILPLSEKDKYYIRKEIQLNTILLGLFHLAALVLFAITIIVFYFFMEPTEGFVSRACGILALIFLSYGVLTIVRCFKNYRDLKGKSKLKIVTLNFSISNKSNETILSIPNQKDITITTEIAASIRPKQELTVEITQHSRLLLFISHNSKNLLDLD